MGLLIFFRWRKEGEVAVAPPEPEAPEEDDDDFDFFGSDDDDEEELKAAQAAREKAAKKKKKNVEKSNVCIGVNPMSVDIDMGEVEDHCRSITMDGLDWKASVLEDVAFGIKKLKISMNIVDDLVSTDEVEELIQAHDGVASTEIVHFTKL